MTAPTRLGQIQLSGGIPASALAPDDPAAAAAVPTKLAAARARAGRGELVTVRCLGPVDIKLIGSDPMADIEAEVFKAMEKKGLPAIALHAFSYDMNRNARMAAAAFFDPDDVKNGKPRWTTPFGTVDEWLAMDNDVLFQCKLAYRDVQERLDPAGATTLDDATKDELIEALKKSEATPLLSSGVVTLTLFLLSGAVQLASSPTPASKSGGSSADTSSK